MGLRQSQFAGSVWLSLWYGDRGRRRLVVTVRRTLPLAPSGGPVPLPLGPLTGWALDT